MTSTTSIPTETTERCDPKRVKVGDVYSRHSFGVITKIEEKYDPITRQRLTLMTIRNSNGNEWNIGSDIVGLEFSIAGQFEATEKVSRTRMIEVLMENPRTAMTINFNKKVKSTDVADSVLELINKALADGKAPTKASVRKFAAEQQTGEERTMVGYHVCSYDEHGRLRFNESEVGQRLVDPRTLNWMIVDRVKYEIGK